MKLNRSKHNESNCSSEALPRLPDLQASADVYIPDEDEEKFHIMLVKEHSRLRLKKKKMKLRKRAGVTSDRETHASFLLPWECCQLFN